MCCQRVDISFNIHDPSQLFVVCQGISRQCDLGPVRYKFVLPCLPSDLIKMTDCLFDALLLSLLDQLPSLIDKLGVLVFD